MLAAVLHFSQPMADKNDKDMSYHALTIGFIISLLLPIVDFIYLKQTFLSNIWGAFLFALSGLLFRIYSIQYLGKQFTSKVKIVEEHQLITSGPYKKIRHPSYTGSFMMLLGNALMYGSWLGICAVVFFMLPAFLFRIRVEEKTLTAFFGQKYIDYKSRTRPLV
ncbi:MAG: isoprenylcysteine carboxylmethyltransferase family protein [Bdellovibrionota bacterium]